MRAWDQSGMLLVHPSFILRDKGYVVTLNGLLRLSIRRPLMAILASRQSHEECSYDTHKLVYFPTSERDDRRP